jgi:hypothetical protein
MLKFKLKSKKVFILIFLLAITLVMLVFFSKKAEEKKSASLPPVLIQDTTSSTEPSKIGFYYTNATPPPGNNKFIDRYKKICFEFSAPVDINSAEIKIYPYAMVDKFTYETSPQKLCIMPNIKPWRDKTQYNITIEALKSLEGVSLTDRVTYTYYNEEPAFIENIY